MKHECGYIECPTCNGKGVLRLEDVLGVTEKSLAIYAAVESGLSMRQVMRAFNVSSPSVVNYHHKRVLLRAKENYGNPLYLPQQRHAARAKAKPCPIVCAERITE